MTSLYHVGVEADAVPLSIVLIGSDLVADDSGLTGWHPSASRREYFSGLIDDVLVCGGAYGAPATIIALEELVRAGARQCVALSACYCERCAAGEWHASIVTSGAVRHDRITDDYAPREYPAVPAYELFDALRASVPGAVTGLVRTMDVAPSDCAGLSESAFPVAAVDLVASAVLVVGAASGIRSASVVLCARASQAEIDGALAGVVRALSLSASTGAGR